MEIEADEMHENVIKEISEKMKKKFDRRSSKQIQ